MTYRNLSNFNRSFQLFWGKTIGKIITINVILFIVLHLFPKIPLLQWCALQPAIFLKQFAVWQLISYGFLHVGLFHLLFNMLLLWFFGSPLEQRLGKKEFSCFFLFILISSGIVSLLFGIVHPAPVIGLSAVVFGLLVVFSMLYPETQLLLFFVFPIKIKYAIYVFACINILAAISSGTGGVGYIVQLFGGLFGYWYLKYDGLRNYFVNLHPDNFSIKLKKKKNQYDEIRREELDLEVDRILDKISEKGLHTLTPKERKILDKKKKLDDKA